MDMHKIPPIVPGRGSGGPESGVLGEDHEVVARKRSVMGNPTGTSGLYGVPVPWEMVEALKEGKSGGILVDWSEEKGGWVCWPVPVGYAPPTEQRQVDRDRDRKVVPEGMEEAYLDLKEVARTAKRNDGMDPRWWVNMCKWAWDESVPD